ncbi:MAG TPA: EamA family transporter, partial [Acidimicrobiia bacterium]|nr:EamA family transporter [Acidimicrobiia bacterium]
TGVLLFGAARGRLVAPSAHALAALCGNGLATALAFTLFFVALGRMGPTRTGIVMTLEAVFGIVLIAIFLSESVSAIVVVGGVAVLSGAVLAALGTTPRVEYVEGATPP